MTIPPITVGLPAGLEDEQAVYLEQVKRAYAELFGEPLGVRRMTGGDWSFGPASGPPPIAPNFADVQGGSSSTAMSFDPNSFAAQQQNQKGFIGRLGDPEMMDREELVGAAEHWGLTDAREMPDEALRAFISEQRSAPRDGSMAGNLLGGLGMMASKIASGATRLTEGILETVQQVIEKGVFNNPLDLVFGNPLDEALGRTEGQKNAEFQMRELRAAREWLASFNENMRSTMDETHAERADVVGAASFAVGVSIPGAAIQKAVSAATGSAIGGAYFHPASRIARGGWEGAATAFLTDVALDPAKPMLPSSGDFRNLAADPSLENAANLIFGNRTGTTAFGAVMGAALSALVAKMEKSPATRSQIDVESIPPEVNQRLGSGVDDIPFAEYEILNDNPLSSPLGGPRGLLGAGTPDAPAAGPVRSGPPAGPSGPAPTPIEPNPAGAVGEVAVRPSGRPMPAWARNGARPVLATPTSPEPQVLTQTVEMIDWFRQMRDAGVPITPNQKLIQRELQRLGNQLTTAHVRADFLGTPIPDDLLVPRFEMGPDGPRRIVGATPANRAAQPNEIPAVPYVGLPPTDEQNPYFAQLAPLAARRFELLSGNNPARAVRYQQLRADLDFLTEITPTESELDYYGSRHGVEGDVIEQLKEKITRYEADNPWVKEFEEIEREMIRIQAGMDPILEPNETFKLTDQEFQRVVTPAGELVAQIGTAFRWPDGRPMKFSHGTNSFIESIDLTRVDPESLYGPAFYASSSPSVTAGDIHTMEPASPTARNAPYVIAQHPNTRLTGGADPYAFVRYTDAAGPLYHAEQNLRQYRDELEGIKAYQRLDSWPTADADIQIRRLTKLVEQWENRVAELTKSVGAPNAHVYYAASKKPFDVRQTATPEIIREVLMSVYPDFIPAAEDLYRQFEHENFSNIKTLDDLYTRLAYDLHKPGEDHELAGLGYTYPHQPLGKVGANDALRKAGYDAIVYPGGRITSGNENHLAIAVLDPSILINAYANETVQAAFAAQHGIQLSKQQIVMDSPEAVVIAAKSEVTESDVARAALSRRPGDAALVKRIADPAKLVQDLVEGKITSTGLDAKYWRFVEREGHVDLIMNPYDEITDEVAAAYEATGYFPGQRVIYKGKERIVAKVYQENGKWKLGTFDGNKPYIPGTKKGSTYVRFNLEGADVGPFWNATNQLWAPELWADFKSYAALELSKLSMETNGAPIDLFSKVGMSQMPRLFEQFVMDRMITEPAVALAIRAFFDSVIPEEYRALAGAELAEFDAQLAKDLHIIEDDAEPSHTLSSIAEWRGLHAYPDTEGGVAWVVEDTISPKKWIFEDEAGARDFVANFIREPLDAEPFGEVPVDVAESSRFTSGDIEGLDVEDHLVETIASGERFFEELETEIGAGGNGGDATPPPPNGGSGSSGGSLTPATPPPTPPVGPPPTFGGAVPPGGTPKQELFTRLAYEASNILAKLDSFYFNHIAAHRFRVAELQQIFADRGFPFKPYDTTTLIKQGMDRAHYHQHDTIVKLASAAGEISRMKIRKGLAWRLLAVRDPLQRSQIGKTSEYGFSDREIEAVGRIEDVLRDLHGDDHHKYWTELRRYVNEVTTNIKRGVPNPYPDPLNYPDIAWFATKAKDTRMDLEVPNVWKILESYVRSYHFNKEVGAAWNKAVREWREMHNFRMPDGSQPLQPLARQVLDWLKIVRYGYEPGYDMAVDAVQSVFNRVGIPLSKGEVAHTINGAMNNTYRAYLGWRVFPIIRDATQSILSIPFVGTNNLRRAYTLKGTEREEMFKHLIEYGIALKGMPPVQSGLVNPEELRAPGRNQFTPDEMERREFVEKLRDISANFMPKWLRNASGSRVDPMYWYTKQNSWTRANVGIASIFKFREEFLKWNEMVKTGVNQGTAPNLDLLIKALNLDGFQPSMRRLTIEALRSGNWPEAEKQYANLVTDFVMHRHGVAEAPVSWQGRTSVRLGMQFGSFAMNTISGLRMMSRYASTPMKAKMAVLLGITGGGLAYLSAKTGWKLLKYHPLTGVFFGGGPAVDLAKSGLEYMDSINKMLTGYELTERDVPSTSVPEALTDAAQTLNPARGAFETIGAAIDASQSYQPGTDLLRYFVSGERVGSTGHWMDQQSQGGMLDNLPPMPGGGAMQ